MCINVKTYLERKPIAIIILVFLCILRQMPGKSILAPLCENIKHLNIYSHCTPKLKLICDKDSNCKRAPTICPKGFTDDGNLCVFSKNKCQSGYYLKDGVCLTLSATVCPAGLVSEGDYCVEPPEPCPERTTRHGDYCAPTSRIVCPEGYMELDDNCIPVHCPQGFHNKGDKCLPDIVCPVGFELKNNQCIYIIRYLPCRNGMRETRYFCIPCPTGTIEQNGSCVISG